MDELLALFADDDEFGEEEENSTNTPKCGGLETSNLENNTSGLTEDASYFSATSNASWMESRQTTSANSDDADVTISGDAEGEVGDNTAVIQG